jgi:hypothetical protein
MLLLRLSGMRDDILLVCLTILGPAFCWLPVSVQPNLEVSGWIPLAFAAVCTGLSTTLHGRGWPLFLLAATFGTFGGLCFNYAIQWPSDPIAGTLVPYSIAVNTVLAFLVSLLTGLVGRRLSVSNARHRRAILIVLLGFVAFGPAMLAMTAPLVRRRLARNDRLASERFTSLRRAVQRTAAEAADPMGICDGSLLQQNYVGPTFSREDWRRITGNYVKQDGYFFMVYCREKGGYTIDAQPIGDRGYGTRHFCADESRMLGCRVDWNGSRYQCLSCTK